MTAHNTADAATCPHCNEDIADRELGVLQTAGEAVLVCPSCDTVLGGAVSDEVFVGLASLALADDIDEVAEVLDQLDRGVSPDGDGQGGLDHYAVTE
jgi:hypothetical protein